MMETYDRFGDYDDDPDGENSILGEEGCLFPDACCMPWPHYTTECHTVEDLQEYMSTEEDDQ